MPRIVGLIGGMSWQTTSVYYAQINQHINSRLGGIHSANLLIRSVDYAEISKLVTTGDFKGMASLFCKVGHELKAAGAQALVLCANVAHKTADSVEKDTGLPVLHIVDFTGKAIVDSGYNKVGLLATRAVMEEEFYKARLRDRYGLEVFVPDEEFRRQADGMIFNKMSKEVIPEEVKKVWRDAYWKLYDDYKVDCVVLACTELQFLFGAKKQAVPSIETTTVHARGIADWALEGDSLS